MPQVHLPGAQAEVDFGDFHAMIAGALLAVHRVGRPAICDEAAPRPVVKFGVSQPIQVMSKIRMISEASSARKVSSP